MTMVNTFTCPRKVATTHLSDSKKNLNVLWKYVSKAPIVKVSAYLIEKSLLRLPSKKIIQFMNVVYKYNVNEFLFEYNILRPTDKN